MPETVPPEAGAPGSVAPASGGSEKDAPESGAPDARAPASGAPRPAASASAALDSAPSPPGVTLVLGGARSGKSRHAEALATALPGPWLYLATAQALDAEMAARIAHHRDARGPGWETREAPLDLAAALEAAEPGRAVLVDCLTLWLSNLMLAGRDPEAEGARLAATLARPRGPWILVANEVGMGIVPENALARAFRDAAGRLNQRVAALAGTVVLVAAGLPLRMKG